jgi:hypothetical protein
MKFKTIVLAALLTFALLAGAEATTFTFTPSIGNWSDPQNWLPPGGPPEAGDQAIIPADKTCQVTDERNVEFITVEEDGVLKIYPDGGELHIGATAAPGPPLQSTLDGDLIFIDNDPGQAEALLAISQDVTIQGDGRILGYGLVTGSDTLTIDEGVQLMRDFVVECRFMNSATVIASTKIEFWNYVSGDGTFSNGSNGKLYFKEVGAPGLSADFVLNGSLLAVGREQQGISVVTSGSLVWNNGQIVTDGFSYFKVGFAVEGP